MTILRGHAGIDFVGMDIVEVAPAYDMAEITALAAAHIAHESLALYAMRPGGLAISRARLTPLPSDDSASRVR